MFTCTDNGHNGNPHIKVFIFITAYEDNIEQPDRFPNNVGR